VVRRTLGTGDKQEAAKRERDMLRRLESGEPLGVVEYTIQQAADDVLVEHYTGRKYAAIVRYAYGQIVEHFGAETPLRMVSAASISNWIKELDARGDKPGTINRKVAALQRMLRHAAAQQRLHELPRFPVKRPESRGRMRVVTRDEENALVIYFEDTGQQIMADLIVVLVDTGARLSEALRLTHRDVSTQNGLVTFVETKNGSTRSVPMTKRVAVALARWVVNGGPAFAGITQGSIAHRWKAALKSCGLDKEVNRHALRHTCASRLLAEGVDLYTIKQWLGHSTIKVTERYAHLDPSKLAGARDALERVPMGGNVLPLARRAQG